MPEIKVQMHLDIQAFYFISALMKNCKIKPGF